MNEHSRAWFSPISRGLQFSGKLLQKIANRLDSPLPDKMRVELAKWFRANGDKTLRLEYELDEHSLVFDLGGYQGQWTSDIFSMYRCSVWVFEPVPAFAEIIRRRFSRNDKIQVFEFGLAENDHIVQLGLSADASSLFRNKGDHLVDAKMVKCSSFLMEKGIENIDLAKINIEGGEYSLLEHLINASLVSRFANLQIQFHHFVPDAMERMLQIRMGLCRTHSLSYQFDFVWENWRRNF